ncbi:hypothetical protein [Arthrobacter sp. FB24]|uniref:hypothetical protein n=1 Tax=Arthrobacter sp. (strain FB24) TaxID=290399 RepID=UPI0005BCDB7E|nr:hypothetical protein [Arthrobacter sp. FB24]
MTDFSVEQAWWGRLSGNTRRRLAEDPRGKVPGDLVAEVVAAGGSVAGAYWVETEIGPDGQP